MLGRDTQLDLLGLHDVMEGTLTLKDNRLTYTETDEFVYDESRKRFERIIKVIWKLASRITNPFFQTF